MIGCIITGHGDFAPGMTRAMAMIAGTQEHFQVVAFQEGEPLEGFEDSMRTALEGLLQETTGVLIFTDLLGGTPFRTAMVVAAGRDNVEVLTGTNLPMLIEIGLLRTIEEDVHALAEKAVEVGSSGIQVTRLGEMEHPETPMDDEMEGI